MAVCYVAHPVQLGRGACLQTFIVTAAVLLGISLSLNISLSLSLLLSNGRQLLLGVHWRIYMVASPPLENDLHGLSKVVKEDLQPRGGGVIGMGNTRHLEGGPLAGWQLVQSDGKSL